MVIGIRVSARESVKALYQGQLWLPLPLHFPLPFPFPLPLLPLLLLPLVLPLLPLVLPLLPLPLELLMEAAVGWTEYVVGTAAGAGVCTIPAVGAAALVGRKLETVVDAGKGGTTVDGPAVKLD